MIFHRSRVFAASLGNTAVVVVVIILSFSGGRSLITCHRVSATITHIWSEFRFFGLRGTSRGWRRLTTRRKALGS